MSSIHQLSRKTAHSLSIGQVVTSVFSVVKELLENALDAGATSVDVRLDDFGLEKIEVRDNGSGLTPEDTAVMGQAHYTSKIQHLDDMGSLWSFGFRGEALSAVCASCEVTVATRTAAEQAGRLVTLDTNGAVVAQKPVARAQGTTVTAAGLFSRQPVRRQLYSSARRRRDDLRAVETLLAATAVSRPALRLALHHNGTQLLNKAPCGSAKSAAIQVLRSEAARQLQPVSMAEESPVQITVEALLPGPDVPPKIASRSTADQCFIIVNGRVVSYKKIEKLLRHQFSVRHGLSPARVPVSVVRITVPPHQLDVNLEPNKTRLLVLCEDQLLTLLERGLAEFYPTPVTSEAADPPAPSGQPAGLSPEQNTEWTPASGAASNGPVTLETEASALGISTGGTSSTVAENGATLSGAAFEEAASQELFSVDRTDAKIVTDPLMSAVGESANAVKQPVTFVSGSVTEVSVPVTTASKPVTDAAALLEPVTASPGPVTAVPEPVTSVTEPVKTVMEPVTSVRERGAGAEVRESDGVPELSDIQWDASESLFGDNFLGVSMDGGEGGSDRPPPTGDRNSSGTDGAAPVPRPGGTAARSDPWATGRLMDSQGDVIEPTKLVTSHGAPAGQRPKIQPSIRVAFNSVSKPPATNGHTEPVPAPAAGGALAGGGDGGGSAAPAPKRDGPPPAKKPRPAEPGEPEYEPVASQVVRRAGTAFHYYCRDMRRKYLSLDPTMDIGRLSAALADGWKAALPSVKRQFEDMAREDERRYKEDVRKAKVAELIQPAQRTISDFCRVDTELRRLVAPLTPEMGARRPRRRTQKMSLRGMRGEVQKEERRLRGESGRDVTISEARLIGPLESHQAWVVLRSSQLLLVNPLRLSETCTLARLLATYRFPCRPLSPPRPLTSATLGAAAHSTLCRLPRDGSRVADERLEASGFSVEVVGEAARLTAVTDCMEFYGAAELTELLLKVAAGAETLTDSRPARAVSWLRAEAVRISAGGGARMSAEELAALLHEADDLDGECFHGRPLAAPLYDLVT